MTPPQPGEVKSGTVAPSSSGAAFTLPAGYRPSSIVYAPALTTNGANVITPGYVGIYPSGDVVVAVGNNAFVALDMSFRP